MYSNPMCECITTVAARTASVIGWREPAANGATVRGMRAAETIYVVPHRISNSISAQLPVDIRALGEAWGKAIEHTLSNDQW